MLPSATVAVRTVALPRPVCPPAWTLTGMIRFSQLSPFAARRTTWHGIWAGGEWCSCQRHDGAGACGAVCGAVESSQRSTDWPDRADPGELPPSWPWTTNCSRRPDVRRALLQEHIAQHEHAKHRSTAGRPRVSAKKMLSDLQKVVSDVETDMKYRHAQQAERRRRHASHPTRKGEDEGKNMRVLDHMMDSLDRLAGSGASHHEGARGRVQGRFATGSGKSAKRIAEMKLSRKPGVARGGEVEKAPSTAPPPDKKKAAIVARMKALQSQILGDFKKVTGFGKQAGYVPPPKIPQM